MIREAIGMLATGRDLSEQEMAQCIGEIMDGVATEGQMGAFLMALKLKGETIEELSGAALAMRQRAIKISAPEGAIDTCGTGGDNSGTFNISTASAIVVAACGVPVAKHGNRSVTSKAGSADVLEALGVKIDLRPEQVEACLFETNFGFLFAPNFHPAMRHAAKVRRDIGIRTIFNLLGPITNPACTKRQIIGIFDPGLTERIAHVLNRLGSEMAWVVHGLEGIDEVSLLDKTLVSELTDGKVQTFCIDPAMAGLKSHPLEAIIGGTKEVNAEIILSILEGTKGPQRDIVLLNAAAALVVAAKASDLKTGVSIAAEAVDSKRALNKLKQVVGFTNA